MPLYDFLCSSCGHEFEDTADYDQKRIQCPHCETETAERLPPLIGGYRGSFGGSSTSPRQAGAFKVKAKK